MPASFPRPAGGAGEVTVERGPDIVRQHGFRVINIRQSILDEFAPLFHEPAFLLREELREIAPYQAVLFAIASGRSSVSAIADATSEMSKRRSMLTTASPRVGGYRLLEPQVRSAPGRSGRPFEEESRSWTTR